MVGKINMYTIRKEIDITSTRGGVVSTSHRTVFEHFMQKGSDVAPVEPFSHRLVRNYVSSYKPSMALIEQSEKAKRTARILGWSALGGFVAGVGMIAAGMSAATQGKNTSIATAGFGVLLVSPFAFIPMSIFRSKSQRYDFQAIEAYNRG
jgi:hypothetical protein